MYYLFFYYKILRIYALFSLKSTVFIRWLSINIFNVLILCQKSPGFYFGAFKGIISGRFSQRYRAEKNCSV
ncbi:hypothetical protein OC25_06895 [Pedobacter kyungheensis]|uniref:Uncharacterized protein n=1 Tax=Pedobacter kyungheensis TaxID=1069985 RepID=A0A0C1DBY4_9SPHI|nr:hypothetical protein OC25_06895 [Pedobacter kyungheensis]